MMLDSKDTDLKILYEKSKEPKQVQHMPDSILKPVVGEVFWKGSTSLDVPIVIDLGSYKCRVGFSNQTEPFCIKIASFHD